MKRKSLIIIFAITIIVLAIPLIAMQFSEEVNWGAFDFAIAAILLLGSGFVIEIMRAQLGNSKYRWLFIGAFIFAVILLWVELAVGIFGSPIAGS